MEAESLHSGSACSQGLNVGIAEVTKTLFLRYWYYTPTHFFQCQTMVRQHKLGHCLSVFSYWYLKIMPEV
jgi:hypothetical protein